MKNWTINYSHQDINKKLNNENFYIWKDTDKLNILNLNKVNICPLIYMVFYHHKIIAQIIDFHGVY